MSETRHVVLAKPGDVLLIGNVGVLDEGTRDACQRLGHELAGLGIKVCIFAEDIQVGSRSDGEGS
jgi:hypothetical protein